ncbi:GNAT family N-acetyltransferase [Streptomyces sp. NPDC046759]|uniref:GNAT family N-acetyltransferase n=1 Tax=Streptomyces sp. NPDC046759 TaxID=3155019 RepID=UPI0033E02C52
MVSLVPRAVAPGTLAGLPQPVLHAGDLTIRPWGESDAADVVKAFRDPAIRHWHIFSVETVHEAREWIATRQRIWRSETGANWAVTRRHDAELIGRVGLRTANLRTGEAEVTYWVLPEARGRGIATAALRELTRWAFEDIGLHRLALAHSTANEASCRVAQKAGFRFEGTQRSKVLHSDGWHDMHMHARINGDCD